MLTLVFCDMLYVLFLVLTFKAWASVHVSIVQFRSQTYNLTEVKSTMGSFNSAVTTKTPRIVEEVVNENYFKEKGTYMEATGQVSTSKASSLQLPYSNIGIKQKVLIAMFLVLTFKAWASIMKQLCSSEARLTI